MENNYAQLDSVFHALADPTRRAVVQRLGRGAATVSELARPFSMSLPSFLKHIGVLEAAGLVWTRKAGRVRTCELRRAELAAAEHWFDDQRKLWDDRYTKLDNLLSTLTENEDD